MFEFAVAKGRRAGSLEGDIGVTRCKALSWGGGLAGRVKYGMGGLLYCEDLLEVLLIDVIIDTGRVRAALGVSES